MIKIHLINWINLLCFFVSFIFMIKCFLIGDIINGILEIIISICNLFIFLLAISKWWRDSKTVKQKFIFTCPQCEYQFVPNFWRWFFNPHIFSMRYFKCNKCGHRSLMKRKKLIKAKKENE